MFADLQPQEKVIVSRDTRIELRKKLMRRLIWKAPLLIALVSFAVWWQVNHDNERGAGKESTAANSHLSAMLAGSWTAEVTYSSGERHREQFFFQPEGDKLYGTASFLGIKRGIEDGKIAGETVSFQVRFEEVADGTTRSRWNRYEGKVAGAEIRLRILDDKGNPPVEIALSKAQATP